MKALDKLIRSLLVSLAILLFFSFFFVEVAQARGGCFAGDTAILTPDGNKAIAQLHSGDRVISYNEPEPVYLANTGILV